MEFLVILLAAILTAARAFQKVQIEDILRGKLVDLGRIDGFADFGELPLKYKLQSVRDQIATKNALEVAESIRRLFPVGVFPLPPLDPYKMDVLDPIPLNGIPFVRGSVVVSDLEMLGASNFVLNDLELRLDNDPVFRTDFNITVPFLHISAEFRATIDLGIASVEISGGLGVDVDNLKVYGAAGALAVPGESIRVNARIIRTKEIIQVNALQAYSSAEHVKVKVNLDSPILSLFKNIDFVVSIAYQMLKRDVANAVSRIAVDQINKIFLGVDMAQAELFLYKGSPTML